MTAQASLEFVRQFIYKKAAIVLDSDKDYLVESRLMPVAKRVGLADIDALVAELRKGHNRDAQNQTIEALTTNETYFFRDQHPFDLLKNKLIPEFAERRSATRRLRIWCGAASTGQEPYSIVMSILDAMPDVSQWTIDFVATDINLTVLDKARSGIYKQHEVNRGLPAASLVKYFQRHSTDWVIKEDLRRLVRFEPLNLLDAWPFSGQFDIIFLRNVLIYFDIETKKRLLGKIRTRLATDGVLFLGGAETTVNLDDAYKNVREGRSVYYRMAG